MTPLLGQLFAVITAACWAQNSIIYSHTGKIVGSKTVTHIRLWIALPMILILHLIFTGTALPLGYSGRTYLMFSLSGVIGFCLADLFIFKAFVDLGPRQTMVILTTSPIFSAILSWLLNNDILRGIEITGMLVTLMGVAMVVYFDRQKSTTNEPKAHHTRGVIVGLAGSLAQAAGVVLSKGGLAHEAVHPVSANFIRLTAGLVALIIYALFRGEILNDFRKVFTPSQAGKFVLPLIIFAALVGPVGGIILNLYALSIVSAGIVSALSQITPVMLLPYERFVQKKRIAPGAVAGTVIAIAGVFMLFLI